MTNPHLPPAPHHHPHHLPHLSAPFFPGPSGEMPLPPISMVSSLPQSLPLPLPMMSHPPISSSAPDQSQLNIPGPGLLKPIISTTPTSISSSNPLPTNPPMPNPTLTTTTTPQNPAGMNGKNTSLNNSPESGSRCSISPRDSGYDSNEVVKTEL